MRIFTAILGTETNTFAPLPTGLAEFEPIEPTSGGPPDEVRHPFGQIVRAARERALRDGHEALVGRGGFATPGGLTTRRAYETLPAFPVARHKRFGWFGLIAGQGPQPALFPLRLLFRADQLTHVFQARRENIRGRKPRLHQFQIQMEAVGVEDMGQQPVVFVPGRRVQLQPHLLA